MVQKSIPFQCLNLFKEPVAVIALGKVQSRRLVVEIHISLNLRIAFVEMETVIDFLEGNSSLNQHLLNLYFEG